MFFSSLDSWFIVLECMGYLLEEVPPLQGVVDAAITEPLGMALWEMIDHERCLLAMRHTVDVAFEDFDEQEEEPLTAEHREGRVDYHMKLITEFSTFLQNCGGCSVE